MLNEQLELLTGLVKVVHFEGAQTASISSAYLRIIHENLLLKLKIIQTECFHTTYGNVKLSQELEKLKRCLEEKCRLAMAKANKMRSSVASFKSMGPNAIALAHKYQRILDQTSLIVDDD